MALLYEVDFRTLATQAPLAAGAVTIDDKVWWLKGSLTNFSASLVNGSGLRLAWVSGTPSGVGSNGDLHEPHFFLPLSEIAGWGASQALLIRGRFNRSGGTPVTGMLGLADTTNDAVGLRSSQRAKDHFVGPAFTSSTTQSLTCKVGAAGSVTYTGRTGSIANNSCVPGILNGFISGWAFPGSEAAPTSLPTDIGTFLPAQAPTSGDPLFQFTSRSNPGVFFGFNTNSGSWVVSLEWLRVDVIGELLDTTLPTVVQVSPLPGAILGRTDPAVYDITDETALRQLYVWVEYPSGEWETAYARNRYGQPDFSSRFRRSSLVDLIAGRSKRLTLRRNGGWPFGELTVHVEPIDSGGNTS